MSQHAVVSPHLLSASAARAVLDEGGNAVDGAVAAVAAQGVAAPETCGIGGDLFAIVHAPGWDRPKALNSSGRAGSKSDPESLRSTGHTDIPLDHPLAVTVPGCVDGLETLSTSLGRLGLARSLQPAIQLARDGFEVSTEQAVAFHRKAGIYATNPAVRDFYPNGKPVTKGDRVSRSDLAATLEAIADGGRDSFYQGRPGEDIIEAVDGNITAADLTESNADWIEPLEVAVGNFGAWTIPPNSQGYLGPATLAVFERLAPPDDPEDPLWWHLLIEAYRSMAWERNDVVADPDHAPLSSELLVSPDRLDRAASTVSTHQTGIWPRTGAVSGTAYLCVADGAGMSVSIIQSNYRGTGSPFGARRSGFLLQDRGLGFTLTPGHPNEVAPGKRPLHTLSPTLWTHNGEPRWILGCRGGAVQPQLVAQVAARAIVGGADLEDAQQGPRWTVSDFGPFSEPRLAIEPTSEPILSGLGKRGHQIELKPEPQAGWGPVSIIELDGESRRAANDPRVDTTSAQVWPAQ